MLSPVISAGNDPPTAVCHLLNVPAAGSVPPWRRTPYNRAQYSHHQDLRWTANRESSQRLPLAVPLNCNGDHRLAVRYYTFEVQWSERARAPGLLNDTMNHPGYFTTRANTA